MIYRVVTRCLLGWAILSLLSGCAAVLPSPSAAANGTTAVPVSTATATAPVSPTVTATVPDQTPPAPGQTPVPEETRPSLARPLSGWTIYSNPDFVQGVAVHANQLWAATLGGVVVWDLQTQIPEVFTTNDGLVEIQGNDVVYCAMPEERMLVAHPSGMLSAYDLELKRWSRIPITFDDGTTMTGVGTMLCDSPNRRLIVGSADGLGILDMKTGHWRRIGAAEGLKVDTVRAIDVVGQAIWVAAGDKSAFMIMGSTIFPFNSASGFPKGGVGDLVAAPDQSIWFGYTTGLVHYQDKKWNAYSSQTPSGIPFLSVDFVEFGPDKNIWIASAEEGVCPFNPVTLFCATVFPGTQGTPITDLVVDKNGIAYAGTRGGGVVVMSPEDVNHLRLDWSQLMSNEVYDIASSTDGTIWVSTDEGVNRINPVHPGEAWEAIVPQRGALAFPHVTQLQPASNGLWFFYDQEAAANFFDGAGWLQLDAQKGLTGLVLDAEIDQRGHTWFATTQGIKVWDGETMRSITPPRDLPGVVFQTLKAAPEGMWVGTDRGLLFNQRSQWKQVLPGVSVNTIRADVGEGLLLGTDEGLVRYDDGQSYLWLINLGKEMAVRPRVTSITWDGAGQLWVGTDGDGLFRYNGQRWEQFHTATGLPADHIRSLVTDRLGAVWIAASTGKGGGALVRYMP